MQNSEPGPAGAGEARPEPPRPRAAFLRLVPLLLISLALAGTRFLPPPEPRETGPSPRVSARPQDAAASAPETREIHVLALAGVSLLFLWTVLLWPSLRRRIWPERGARARRWPSGLVAVEAAALFLLLGGAVRRAAALTPWHRLALAPALSLLVVIYALARERGTLRERAGALGLAGGAPVPASLRAGAAGWLALFWFFPAFFVLVTLAMRALDLDAASLLQLDQRDAALRHISPLLGSPGRVAAWALLVAVAAPLSEEILFRGILYGAMRRHMGTVPAAAASALAFAAVHGMWLGAAPLFVLGYVLARVYERTDSIWAPCALHAIHNGATLALVLLA